MIWLLAGGVACLMAAAGILSYVILFEGKNATAEVQDSDLGSEEDYLG